MKQKSSSTMIVSCILVYSLVLGACGQGTSLPSNPLPSPPPTPSRVMASIPSATIAVTATPTASNKTFIITPDTLFSISGLKSLNTPNSKYFCEHIPAPEVIENPNELSLLAGRFSLCPSISWPLVETAMDLDTGTLVSVDAKSGDISMDYSHPGLDGGTFYAVFGLNNAHIGKIDTNTLNYEYCQKALLGLNDPGVFVVLDRAIACVLTTEGRIALIRVEQIYPSNTQGVEFSFAVLKE